MRIFCITFRATKRAYSIMWLEQKWYNGHDDGKPVRNGILTGRADHPWRLQYAGVQVTAIRVPVP